MRKQAEQLVIGRVYADMDTNYVEPTFLRFIGVSDINLHQFTRIKGDRYGEDSDGIIVFPRIGDWYELTPEEDAIYNKPSEPTFILSDDNKDLQYWKKNAEENYMTTPISVLRYISELEKVALAEPPKS